MTMYLTDLGGSEQTNPLISADASTRRPPSTLYRDIFKPALDFFLVILAAPLSVPLILLLAFLVATDGYNPFYTQLRVGKNGKPFRIWKLRTMLPDADLILQDHLARDPEAAREWETTQKLKNDPRVTPVGRLLRKTSLDELPQFVNVVNGTMSLVGPRPMMLAQQDAYPGRSYYDLRPGITGMWQVSDRNDCSFAGRATYDDYYGRILSFRTDLSVLARTVLVVLRGTGC